MRRHRDWSFVVSLRGKEPAGHRLAGKAVPAAVIDALESCGEELVDDLADVIVRINSLSGNSFSIRAYPRGRHG